MEPVYVTGHRNPDTDSIVSAIAYAALRNALGDREFVPARLGHISDETNLILTRFGYEPPVHLQTMRTQVCDLDFDTPPALDRAVTVGRAWEALYSNRGVPSLPVTKDDGCLYGMVSPKEIAAYDMRTLNDSYADHIPMFNLLSVLDGKIINEAGHLVDSVSGEVCIALPQNNPNLLFTRKESIVICGQQPEMARRAIEMNVSCLIICQAELPEDLRSAPTDTCIIVTPYDAFKAARMIYQAIPIQRVCRTDDLEAFHLTDFVDDVKETVSRSRHRSYPILDENEKVVGTLSRFHLIKPKRKRVVLVDHNEMSQSVPGLEQAEILEIIDHHRLADIQTGNPIYFRNEPVGSTATIIASMYQEKGLMPSEKLAGLIASASSPTPSCSNPPPARRTIIAWPSAWRVLQISRLTSLANLSSLPPILRISPPIPCSLPTSRTSISRGTTSASARLPAWTQSGCSSARRNFCRSWRTQWWKRTTAL